MFLNEARYRLTDHTDNTDKIFPPLKRFIIGFRRYLVFSSSNPLEASNIFIQIKIYHVIAIHSNNIATLNRIHTIYLLHKIL